MKSPYEVFNAAQINRPASGQRLPEQAARLEGWRWDEGGPHFYRNAPGASPFAPYEYQHIDTCDWRELCRREGIEP